jgi:uncharacterized protein
MIMDVDKIPKEGLSVSRDFEFLNADLVEESAEFLGPTHVEAVIRRISGEVWIKGKLTARVSIVCSRCLTPYEFPVDASFDLVYLPEELDILEEELDEDEMGRVFYHNNQIDLGEVILEQLNLTFPIKPLCSEKCEGICAVCGQIRREGKCACLVREEGPRLRVLKNLLREKE